MTLEKKGTNCKTKGGKVEIGENSCKAKMVAAKIATPQKCEMLTIEKR